VTNRVLVVDDEPNYLLVLRELLGRDGYIVDAVPEPLEGLKLAHRYAYDCALIDLRMGNLDGLEVLKRLRRIDPHLAAVIMTAYATVETAVESIKEGALDYVLKPFENETVLKALQRSVAMTRLGRESERLKEPARADGLMRKPLGDSPAMRKVEWLVRQVAPTDTPVLISGEPGTRKEDVARAIHRASTRSQEPFVAVHCGALPENSLECELFGHEAAGLVGAQSACRVRSQRPTRCTLFVDEVDSIPPALQVKLLDALEPRSFESAGGELPSTPTTRFIGATSRDLDAARREGRFREDLYYRLNVVHIRVPPLRERREDIPLLAPHLLKAVGARVNRPRAQLSDRALQLLMAYDWPGNLRELENVLERSLVLSEGDRVGEETLPLEIREPGRRPKPVQPCTDERPLQDALESVEKNLILRALEKCDYVQAKAAQSLGLSKSALHYKLTKHQIRIGTPPE